MPKMRAVEVTSPRGPFKVVERETPQPGPRQVRIKVQACGFCHSASEAYERMVSNKARFRVVLTTGN
jgi:D-arabinose 1-dehydrogenase-like Zn-dependent alcohol dehydrogenase